MKTRLHVAVGVILNKAQDSVLISKRGNHQHLGGYWEFPGGKLHEYESVNQALQRELAEELGINVNGSIPFMQVAYDYPDKKVLLDVHKVVDWEGEAVGLEQQEIKWLPIQQLDHSFFPPANRSIVTQLLLPDVYLLSRQGYRAIDELTRVLAPCIENGLKLFQLRLAEADARHLHDLVAAINEINTEKTMRLVLNGKAEDIEMYDINGIHLNSRYLLNYSERPIAREHLLGASCHNEKEIEQAERIDVDYVFISPVKLTSSHPDARPLGWTNFSKLSACTSKPVYALGGMGQYDLAPARQSGAAGIAMIESVWGAQTPEKVIRAMLSA